MSHRQKKALEMAMRDAMDGMEQLASMMAYRRLPEDMEILGIGFDIEAPAPIPSAEIIPFEKYRSLARRPTEQTAPVTPPLENTIKS